jgi:3-hydroxybutyrate dehydrogenase
MRARNFGRIFNMTSVYSLRGTIDRVDYVTTKSALLGLTRAVALENLGYDVTRHGICPGSVLTPGTEQRIAKMMRAEKIDRATAEHRFLCGPTARDMTGAFMPVEAGWLPS